MESLHIRLTGRYIPGTGPPVVAPAPLQQPYMRRKQPQIGVLRKPSRPHQPRRSEMRPAPAVVTAPPPQPPTENTVPEVVFEDETM